MVDDQLEQRFEIAVAGVLVLLKTSFSQAIGGQLVSIVWLAVIVWLKPYKNRGENVCSTIINVAVCVVMTGAVATKLTDLQAAMRLYTDVFQDIIDRQFAIAMSWTGLIAGIVVVLIGCHVRGTPAESEGAIYLYLHPLLLLFSFTASLLHLHHSPFTDFT